MVAGESSMSAKHDMRATIKLTPDNCRGVDRKARELKRKLRVKFSRASVANSAIAIGIKHLK